MVIADNNPGEDLVLERQRRIIPIIYSLYEKSIPYARVNGEWLVPITDFNQLVRILISFDEEKLREEEGRIGKKIFELSCLDEETGALENYLEICEEIRPELMRD